MVKKDTKKTSRTSEENKEQTEQTVQTTEVKKRAVTTGKPKKDWKEEEHVSEESDQEEEQDQEAVSDPEKESVVQVEQEYSKVNKRQSIFDKLDLQAIEKLDKEKLSGLTNEELLQVLYVRGMTQKNPSVYHSARKALLELSLEPKHNFFPRRSGPPRNHSNSREQSNFRARGRGSSQQGTFRVKSKNLD